MCLAQGRSAEAAAVRGVHKCGGQQGMLPAAPRCLAGRRRHRPHPHPPWTLALPGQPTGKITSTPFLRHISPVNSLVYHWGRSSSFSGAGPDLISGNSKAQTTSRLHLLPIFPATGAFLCSVKGILHR